MSYEFIFNICSKNIQQKIMKFLSVFLKKNLKLIITFLIMNLKSIQAKEPIRSQMLRRISNMPQNLQRTTYLQNESASSERQNYDGNNSRSNINPLLYQFLSRQMQFHNGEKSNKINNTRIKQHFRRLSSPSLLRQNSVSSFKGNKEIGNYSLGSQDLTHSLKQIFTNCQNEIKQATQVMDNFLQQAQGFTQKYLKQKQSTSHYSQSLTENPMINHSVNKKLQNGFTPDLQSSLQKTYRKLQRCQNLNQMRAQTASNSQKLLIKQISDKIFSKIFLLKYAISAIKKNQDSINKINKENLLNQQMRLNALNKNNKQKKHKKQRGKEKNSPKNYFKVQKQLPSLRRFIQQKMKKNKQSRCQKETNNPHSHRIFKRRNKSAPNLKDIKKCDERQVQNKSLLF